MMKNVRSRNLSSSLTSNKNLKTMLGEEEEILEQDEIEEEAELDLDDDKDAAADYDDDNESELEETDTDEDELDLDDADDEVDSEADGAEDDEIDGDAEDNEADESGDDDWDAEEDDLLILKFNKRKPKLSEGEYMARVGRITAEKKKGQDGEPWVKVTLPFEVKNASGVVTVPFRASMSLSPKGRLYPIVKGILGRTPEEGLNMRELQGKRVKVEIGHYVDDHGSVWEEVISVKKVG